MAPQLRITGFHPTRNINQNSGGAFGRTGEFVASGCKFELALNLIMLMDVQYIHPPVGLASSCYLEILEIYLDIISYTHVTLCLRSSSRAALGNRIQVLSYGEVNISLSGNGSVAAHYCFS